MSQQKEKSKPPKKHNFRNNKPNNKGPKPFQSAPSLKNDKGSKQKGKKTERHYNFYGKDNHDESKCFKKMETLEATMKKHHISLDSSLESTSHGHALCTSVYSYTTSSSSTQMNGSLLLEQLIIWLRSKPSSLLCMSVTPKRYLLVLIDL